MASLDSAPRDGSEVELLFDGEWIEAYWSEQAYDGSPQGTEGWAQSDGGYLVLDAEAWRPLQSVSYGEPTELPGHSRRQPVVVVGLGFGDEAKGATVDYLSSTIPDAAAVVRWSGGANAAHNVRHGHRHHTFRQFGSGSLLGLPTFLTDRVVLNLQMLMAEAVNLQEQGIHNPLGLVVLHGDSLVTTPIHMALNRAREILRGADRHGSCGLGIGETVAHGYAEQSGLTTAEMVGNFEIPGPTAHGDGVLTAGMLIQQAEEDVEARVLRVLKHQARYAEPLIRRAIEHMPKLADELWYGSLPALAQELVEIANSVDVLPAVAFDRELERTMASGTVIFEGSQGLLLDEMWGFHPHTTWAQTEPSRLVGWLEELGHRPYVLGLTRSYMTRHGAGPLPSQDVVPLTEAELPADDNSWGRWQGGFRVAALDVPLLHYSLKILRTAGIIPDGLSISHLDAFEEKIPVVLSYGEHAVPSSRWHFHSNGAEDFPVMDSDRFLEDLISSKTPGLEHFSPEELPGKLSAMLRVPTVLLARGPERLHRSIHTESKKD